MENNKRRKFIKLGLVGAALGFIDPLKASTLFNSSGSRSTSSPVVISTWNHGIAANRAAWEVLSNGGKALDAVEKGVRVTEGMLP